MGEILLQLLKSKISSYSKQIDALENEIHSEIEGKKEFDSDKIDSLGSIKAENIERYINSMLLLEKLNNAYEKGLALYNKYSNYQSELKSKKALVDGYSGESISSNVSSITSEKKESFLSSIKTFDIGLTYPQTTALSDNSIPLNGINIEIQRGNWYTAVAAGITLNNLMVTNDLVQNSLNNNQNLFNLFDFQEIKQKRFLSVVKSGYGTKEGSHAFIGIRYQNKAIIENYPDSITVPSIGAELDLKWVPSFDKSLSLKFVYGRTSYSEGVLNSEYRNVVHSMFSSAPTNTALVKIEKNIAKIKTKISGSIRFIDPLADTKSMGVLQSDNVRYELKTKHKITSKMSVGFLYREDRNNVRGFSDTTVNLRVFGTKINGKINSNLGYFGMLNYVTFTNRQDVSTQKMNNYIIGAGITARYKIRDYQNALTLSYSDYLITDSSSTGFYRNIGIQNNTKLKKGVNTLSFNYYTFIDEIVENNTSLIFGEQYTFSFDKISISTGIKVSFSEVYDRDFGAKVEVSWLCLKWLEWSFKGEKLILGDFYNYYQKERFERFPYALTTNLKFILK